MTKNKINILSVFFKLFSIVTLTLVLGSCAKEDEFFPVQPGDDSVMTFVPNIQNISKARIADNEFESSDNIGIYVVPFDESTNLPGDISTSDYAVNQQLIFNGGAWITPSGTKIPWPTPKRNVDIYGYYPYQSLIDNPLQMPFTVNENQTTKEGFQQSDFLWNKTSDVIPTKNPINLSFSHKMSKVRVNVKTEVESIINDLPNATIYITNVKPSAVINLADGNVSENISSGTVEIGSFSGINPTEGYLVSSEAIIAPQTIGAGKAFIRIEIPGTNTQAVSFIPSENIAFESGKERSFNITITRGGISVSTGPIAEWQTSDIIEGEIGKPIPQVLDLESINWNSSLVQKVYNKKGVQIAEIAKEYIFKQNTVDYQAIVIYPMGVDGKPDISKGFIAQVMNRTRNSSTNEYEPNTASIHGGTVYWGSNNTLSSYTAGAEALFNKIEISNGEFKPAGSASITTLTTSPDVITDIDGNQYSIVKISSQYWASENLKVERFRDGSSATYYYYNDDQANKGIYGALYTWDVIMDSKGLAPEGWHVPENNEFILLYQYLTPDAGRKLKANILWSNLNYNDNVTGFSGLPGGRRTNTGTYNEIYNYGQWWSTTATSTTNAYRLYLDYGNNAMQNTNLGKTYTQSIRVLRD